MLSRQKVSRDLIDTTTASSAFQIRNVDTSLSLQIRITLSFFTGTAGMLIWYLAFLDKGGVLLTKFVLKRKLTLK